MLPRMIPAGLGMSTRTTFGDQTDTAHSLNFTLHLAGQDRLTLETGEVFQNPGYASVRGNKRNEISATLNVRPAPDERQNEMRYFEAVTGDDYGSPPMIHFEVSIPASDYSLLLNNIRGGIMPSSLTVELPINFHTVAGKEASPLKYGNAPNGSEMIWRNATEQSRRVDVKSIVFYYQLFGAGYDDDEDAKPPTAKASIDAASAAIVAKLNDLEKAFVKGSGWVVTAIIIACAVLYFARH